jgi:2-polyprenyl-3-methyl-5-hydroxy-6-metoxy-1,4-benzoquinol methylase
VNINSTVDPRRVLDGPLRRQHRIPDDTPLDALREPLQSWVNYALGTVDRGRTALADLQRAGFSPGQRLLDAGCAYGGYLAAAAEVGAAEVVGIEIAPWLAAIARELVVAYGVPAQIIEGSVGDTALLARLGRFDAIACCDVIEHVDDPPAVLAALAGALVPGGVLYLTVPNYRNPDRVDQDAHFQYFGVGLLPPPAARSYVTTLQGSPYYDVGEYHTMAWYRASLVGLGLSVELLNPVPEDGLAETLSRRAAEVSARAATFADARLPASLVAATRQAVSAWASELEREVKAVASPDLWSRLRAGLGFGPRERPDLQEYAVPTWNLLARRPASS